MGEPVLAVLGESDRSFIESVAQKLARNESVLLDSLHELQRHYGHLPRAVLEEFSFQSKLPREAIWSAVTFYSNFRTDPPMAVSVGVCTSVTCHLHGAPKLVEDVKRAGAGRDCSVREVSCLGMCDVAPVLIVNGHSVGAPGDAAGIAALLANPPAHPTHALGYETLGEYERRGGYSKFKTIRAQADPQAIIAALKESGLRGMGGAGFGAGSKWDFVIKAAGDSKYVVCNADEGEPGTFKDRLIMESRPHELLEGVLIACATVGAGEAIIYLREEYELSRLALTTAIAEATHAGMFAGPRVPSAVSPDQTEATPTKPRIRIVIGAGAYVCGEETALLESIEGKRGEPRLKPPFPATHGLWQKPTLINNVETLAKVPAILRDGPEKFKAKGSRGAAGTRLFCISGHIESSDVYELPLGTTVSDAIKKAGGVLDGRRLKAFMPGGVSSGFLPATLSETPLDFDSLAKVGSMGGSGALIVVAEGTCMVDLATSCLRFFAHESCGKCTPCRAGTEKMKNMAEETLAGKAALDAGLIGELSDAMGAASICGLGQTAFLPLTSAMKHFPGEFAAHAGGRCLEGTCDL